jgi:micrococcal nuclease
VASVALVLTLIAVVTTVTGIPYLLASGEAQRPEVEPHLVKLDLPAGVTIDSLQRAKIYDVVDGDTIDVILPPRVVRVRYYGVDTPERGDKCYREALDRNLSLVGKEVLLLPDARDEDQFGRALRYVFLTDGTSLDATLVAEGWGHAWTRDGQYKDTIIPLEEEAKAAGRGCLWK